jgi:peptidoglycan L-alanyl-D-glutamate endopeptidase CwlK
MRLAEKGAQAMPALSARSTQNLNRVHPDLVTVIHRAIEVTTQDFGVTEPQVRTLDYQRQLVARGVSKTLKSNHLEQVDLTGQTTTLYGHAADLVPWHNGKFDWDWTLIFPVAAAMAQAAKELGMVNHLCWGGVWDRWMSSYMGDLSAAAMKRAEEEYKARHLGPDFVDGPHFQIYKVG